MAKTKTLLTGEEMKEVIRQQITKYGNAVKAADALSTTPEMLSMILAGDRNVGADLAALLGYQQHKEKVTVTVVFYTVY
jgi:hypothetical protein